MRQAQSGPSGRNGASKMDIENVVSFLMGKAAGVNWKKIASGEFAVKTSSTTAANVGTIDVGKDWTKNDILFCHVRDKAGKQNGHFYGNDAFLEFVTLANGSTGTENRICCLTLHAKADGSYGANYTPNGVYPSALNLSTGILQLQSKYSSSYTLTIDGTYVADVYKLTLPAGVTLFE